MDRFTAMQVFVEIAERGSLTATAGVLDMSRPMVTRYLESLEQWLGVRLLHRTTRKVSLTDAGAEALQRCRQVLELTGDVKSVAGLRTGTPSGRLRITTSTSFAQARLAALVAEFIGLHPQTHIELIAVERTVNLVEERIDLAVRITNRLDDTLVARRLGECRSAICAAPAYLERHGRPRVPADLRGHLCLTHAHVATSEYRLRRGAEQVRVPVAGPFQSNEATVLMQAALAGAGLALLPTYLVDGELASGRLVRVLPAWEPETFGIHATYLSRQHQPLLLRTMLEFLSARLGEAGGSAPASTGPRATVRPRAAPRTR